MCRLLGYLGPSIRMDTLLTQPEHSLVVQSYQPREMTSGVINADGFGVGWYHSQQESDPFVYRNTLPIWSDSNLPPLSRYVESSCILGYVRSATAGQAVQLTNCQPFQSGRILAVHNGYIENFRQTLYRPLRDRLNDACYQAIAGTTDSEHIFALLCNELQASEQITLEKALYKTLHTLAEWAETYKVTVGLNLVLSDGNQLVASRFAYPAPPPSLYWLRDDPAFAQAIVVASEPLFASDQWQSFAANSLLIARADLDVQTYSL